MIEIKYFYIITLRILKSAGKFHKEQNKTKAGMTAFQEIMIKHCEQT